MIACRTTKRRLPLRVLCWMMDVPTHVVVLSVTKHNCPPSEEYNLQTAIRARMRAIDIRVLEIKAGLRSTQTITVGFVRLAPSGKKIGEAYRAVHQVLAEFHQ